MGKVNITLPTGNVEVLNLMSAFKADNNTYVIFDSEKVGSMGLPIIYVSKYTTKLEKMNDTGEWQNAKNHLKGIISGTNFEYITLPENLTADDNFYTPLTLPQSSFDLIKNKYAPNNTANNTVANSAPIAPGVAAAPIVPGAMPPINNSVAQAPQVSPINPINVAPVTPNMAAVNTPNVATPVEQPAPIQQATVAPAGPVMTQANPSPVANNINMAPNINNVNPTLNNNTVPASNAKINIETTTFDFTNDKKTFLKACENMFDALIAKYQKELDNLKSREEELARKEEQATAKLQQASEHLANAEAKEQVANQAFDNAQGVMNMNVPPVINPTIPPINPTSMV